MGLGCGHCPHLHQAVVWLVFEVTFDDPEAAPNRVHVVQELIVELTRAWHDVFAVSNVASDDV